MSEAEGSALGLLIEQLQALTLSNLQLSEAIHQLVAVLAADLQDDVVPDSGGATYLDGTPIGANA